MYVIDTEAEASVTVEAAAKDEPPAEVAAAAPTPAAQPTTSVPPSDNSGRKPSIQFLGKGGWERRRSGTQPISLIPDKPNGTVVLDGSMIDSRYGRPAFTEKEMEALILGGANIAPTVAKHSGGASFSI